MTDEPEQPNMLEPLEPAYEALQRRLLDDGARWRAGLPSTERLEQQLNELVLQEQNARLNAVAAEARKRRSRLRLMDQTKGDSSVFHRPIRTITAVAALVAVVTLFVVLFYGFASGHKGQTGTSGTPTVPPIPQGTPQAPQADVSFPVVAPSDPKVIYKLVQTNGSNKYLLARSDNGGATWRTFSLPGGKTTDPMTPYLFASPLDARAVFLVTIPTSYPSSDTTASCPKNQASTGDLNSYATLSGGSIPCPVVYLSRDGGAHWAKAHLPQAGNSVPAVLGPPYLYNANSSVKDSDDALRAQGNRLYSLMGVMLDGEHLQSISFGTLRLITSTDGGLNWSLADSGLPTNSGSVCDYSPAPTGSTVFAIVGNGGCVGGESAAQVLSLWRSDDAGAHWTWVSQLPGNTEMGMVVVSRGNGQMPLIYINMVRSTCTISPHLSRPNAGGCDFDASPASLQVSADGGVTWQTAPTKGFPLSQPGNALQNPGTPLGVLKDGSVLFVPRAAPDTASFYAWKLGDAAWHKVGPSFEHVNSGFIVPGTNTVCVVTGFPAGYDVHTFTA